MQTQQTTGPEDRKSSQRERLLDGMRSVAVAEGYAAATIAEVIAHAGVSRPTFYDYFSDKDDCFSAAVTDIQQRLSGDIRTAIADGPAEEAAASALRTLVSFATSEPASAQFLMNEPMAGGPRALDARDQGIAEIAGVIEQAESALSPERATPDLSSAALAGSAYRLLASRLRHAEHDMSGVSDGLLEWLAVYEWPRGEQRWRALEAATPPAAAPVLPETLLRAPPPLTRAQVHEPEELAENQRQRIIFATAEVAQQNSYAATTIAEITKQAGVDHRTFNALFAGKQEAFMAFYQLAFQRIMAVCAGAYFMGSTWPERIWEAGRAYTQFLENTPAIAHAGFVEAYGVALHGEKTIEDGFTAFTIFLQEGYRANTSQNAAVPSQLALEAIATTIFEIGYQESRRDQTRHMSQLLGHVSYLCLAPFIGAGEARGFIAGRMEGEAGTGG